jgi:hypothetical protein
MSVVTSKCAWRRRLLVALFLLVPGASVFAQGGPFTLPSVTPMLGGARPWVPGRIGPVRLRLGLAPDLLTNAGERPHPVASPRSGALRAPTVTCPMPVVRRDSSAVPLMPRLDPPVGDRSGVNVPSCRNPLDAR